MDDATPAAPAEAVRVSSTSHRVAVIAEDRSDVRVEGDASVSRDGQMTTVAEVRGRVVVRVPAGTSIVVGSDSGRVEVSGPAGDVAVRTDSGRIEIAEAASVDARTHSAKVVVGDTAGDCRVRTNSGRIEVRSCGGADVATDSGKIVLHHVDGPVDAHCVSGRIEITMDGPHDVTAETVSGRISVSLPGDVVVHESADTRAVTATPSDCDCTVRARSVSGKIAVSNR